MKTEVALGIDIGGTNTVFGFVDKNLLGIFKNKVKLLPSGLKNGETAVLGASALIWNELKSKN